MLQWDIMVSNQVIMVSFWLPRQVIQNSNSLVLPRAAWLLLSSVSATESCKGYPSECVTHFRNALPVILQHLFTYSWALMCFVHLGDFL